MRKAICIAAAVLSFSAGIGSTFCQASGGYTNGYGAGHFGAGAGAYCAYVDADGDGICDYRAYRDQDGDGICDDCPHNGIPARDGTDLQRGAGHGHCR